MWLPCQLVVALLPHGPLVLALGYNLPAQPLGVEAHLEHLEVLHNVPAASEDSILGCDRAVGRDAQLERGKERVRNLVGRKGDFLVLEQPLREQVAQRVVLLVEGENGSVGNACLV